MLVLLFACASAPSPDTSDTSVTAPKMIEAACELSAEGPEFLVSGYTDLPPAAVIYLGAEADDGSVGWRLAESVAYVDGVFHIASTTTSTRCLAYIQ